MASSSSPSTSSQQALYILAPDDANGAFKTTAPDFAARVSAAESAGLAPDSQVLSTIQEVDAYLQSHYPRGVDRLYFRAHGSQGKDDAGQLNGRGESLTLKGSEAGGRISLSASGEQLKTLKKICRAVQPGGTLIVEGCYSGLGKDNLLKFMSGLCNPDVLVVGSRGSEFEVEFDPTLTMHTRFTDANTKQDLTRIYYTKGGKAQHIPVEQFKILWNLFLSKIPSDNSIPLSKAYKLCYELLGERNDPVAFAKIRDENKDLLKTLLGNSDTLIEKYKNMPFTKSDASLAWQAVLTALENSSGAFGCPKANEFSISPEYKSRYTGDAYFLSCPERATPYEIAYRFLLGCAAIDKYKTLCMLFDNGDINPLKNPASVLLHALSDLSIHGKDLQSVTQTLAQDLPMIKESYTLANKHNELEPGLLNEWFTTVIGPEDAACFDGYIERNTIFYFTRLAMEANLGLHIAVQKSDLKAFDRHIANGADLNSTNSDQRSVWEVALKQSSNDMLAKLVLAFPREKLLELLFQIRSMPDSLQKAQTLLKISTALEQAGELDLGKEIQSEIFQFLSIHFQKTYAEDISNLNRSCAEITRLLNRAIIDEDHAILELAKASNLMPLKGQSAAMVRSWLNDPANAHQIELVTTLELSEKGLRTVPQEIVLFKRLTTLYLFNNQLSSLPDTIGSLTNLTMLHLSNNRLSSIPNAIGSLTNLTTLNLAHNELSSIPNAIGSLKALAKLNLDNNQLSSLPNTIGSLADLTELKLFQNQLSSLPDTIGSLTALTKLDFSHNQLSSLPKVIGKLIFLKELHLPGNQLSSLPDTIGSLAALEQLYLSKNQLRSLPDTIGNLSNLTTLSLSDNQLTSIPHTIGSLKALTKLSLNNNQLSSLPDTIGNLPVLTTLNLFRNRLCSLPDTIGNLPALKGLDLSSNQLSFFPGSIGSFSTLIMFCLNDNPWMFISDKNLEEILMPAPIKAHYETFIKYASRSPLSLLFQLIEGKKDISTIQHTFEKLNETLKHEISLLVRQEKSLATTEIYPPSSSSEAASSSGASSSSDHFASDVDLFEDMGLFARSVRKATYQTFEKLSLEQKNSVYGQIYKLAGNPKTSDPKWGEHHAFENVLRFVDALHNIINKG